MSNIPYMSGLPVPNTLDTLAMKRIQVGDDLLDYLMELADIVDDILAASSYVDELSNAISETYRGKASDEMALFFSALSAHLNRLYIFYYKAIQYIQNTYTTMYETEEQLVGWINRNLG